jgi:transcriptional regulator with XRE-family HTH domain
MDDFQYRGHKKASMPIAIISRLFGMAVRQRRMAAGLSQEQLAERAGLHPTYVSMVERAVRNPTLDVSAGIAEALQVAFPTLVEEAQQNRPNSSRKKWNRSSRRKAVCPLKPASLSETS